ncbi:MAG: terminase large subunit domain-containing protein, partial [Acidobacteriota bacterium]
MRSGKTLASSISWTMFCTLECPETGELVMTGKTSKTLERNVISPMMDMFGAENILYRRGSGELWLRDCDRPIHIVGANDERAQDKLRGSTLAGLLGDEITLWPESYFKMALSRLSVKGARFFGTTNPDSPYHWLKKDYLDRGDELDMAVFHFTLDDNETLDPAYVESLKREYTGLWYKRFISGLWVLAEGTVYDMWDEDVHTLDIKAMLERDMAAGRRREPRFRHYFTAVDYGTTNPCTFGLFGHDGSLPAYLVKEYYHDSARLNRQKTDSQYGEDFEAFVRGYPQGPIYVDPSALSFISELRHRG